jgi:hypothetical protein
MVAERPTNAEVQTKPLNERQEVDTVRATHTMDAARHATVIMFWCWGTDVEGEDDGVNPAGRSEEKRYKIV